MIVEWWIRMKVLKKELIYTSDLTKNKPSLTNGVSKKDSKKGFGNTSPSFFVYTKLTINFKIAKKRN